jgi:hypothetical protein
MIILTRHPVVILLSRCHHEQVISMPSIDMFNRPVYVDALWSNRPEQKAGGPG